MEIAAKALEDISQCLIFQDLEDTDKTFAIEKQGEWGKFQSAPKIVVSTILFED